MAEDCALAAQLPFVVDEDFVRSPPQKLAGVSTFDFDRLLLPPLQLYENVAGGCGGQTWPAGMALSKYLLGEPRLGSLRGKRILELGAGSGLVGIAIAVALSRMPNDTAVPADYVELTDQLPMLEIMRRNIELNSLNNTTVTAGVLDWGNPLSDNFKVPDVIIAAECVYFEPAFPLLLQTLKDLIREDAICYFCFKKRRRADLRFMKEARKLFNVEDVKDDPDQPIWSKENLFMYTMTAKR